MSHSTSPRTPPTGVTVTDLAELPHLVSIPRAAKVIGIGYTTARRLIAEGEIPTKQVGKRRWVAKRDLLAYLEDTA